MSIMEPLHRARIELSYTQTMRDKLVAKMEAKLAEYDAKIAQKQALVDHLSGEAEHQHQLELIRIAQKAGK